MGSTNSAPSAHSTINDLNQLTIHNLQESLRQNNVLIGNLTKENEYLRTKMVENALKKKDTDFGSILEKIHEELLDFKESLDSVSDDVNESEAEKEITRLKQENARLYGALKTVDPNYNVDRCKMSNLPALEGELYIKKDKLKKKLEDLKEIMDRETTEFIDTVEKAHGEMKTTLESCKKRLRMIRELQKDYEHSTEMEKIQNIVLQQNNVLVRDLMIESPSLVKVIQNSEPLESKTNNVPLKNQLKNNLDTTTQKEPKKELNIPKDNTDCENKEKAPDDDFKILIFYAEENDNEDDEEKARLILKKLTKKNLSNIKANRMGKKGNRARPIIVTLDKKETVSDILKSRYSLKETEFKGLKIVKFKKDHNKRVGTTSKNRKNTVAMKNKNADATNPLLSDDESDDNDCEGAKEAKEVKENNEETDENNESDYDEEDEDLPFKIVLHYVPETGNEYERVVEILRVLTNRPLRNVGYRRLGLKPKNHVRPIVVSFLKEEYVEDCIKNRRLLKENGFPTIRVNYYRDNLETVY